VLQRRCSQGAAILAVVEDWSAGESDELTEACSRANILFRAVAPRRAEKIHRVDIIVGHDAAPGEG